MPQEAIESETCGIYDGMAETEVKAGADHSLTKEPDHGQQRVWDAVSWRPLHSLWNLQGIPPLVIVKRTWNSIFEDNLLGRAAELGYWFLFALFPTLVSASSILGIVARHASDIYVKMLHYMSLVIPPSAFGIVLETFNQITNKANTSKVTFGLAAALWAASVGFTAIQDSMNAVYKVKETRPYWKARGSAILITVLLSLVITSLLGVLLAGAFLAKSAQLHFGGTMGSIGAWAAHIMSWVAAAWLLMLLFACIYYYAPDTKNSKWHWLTPGAAIGIIGWLLSSFGLRVYLHYFNNYSATYGSLGAVIILLTWFYISGLMLLIGAEVNSEIEAAAAEKRIAKVPGKELCAEKPAGADLPPPPEKKEIEPVRSGGPLNPQTP